MPRPSKVPPLRKRMAGGFLLGMVVGVVIGLAVSLAVAFYLNKTPVPFMARNTPTKPAEKASPANDKTPIAGLPSGTPPPTLPAEQPKFDFYKILPGQEEPVSEKELRERSRQARAQPGGQQAAAKDVYFIQAGSFQNPADADNQKARLAILGIVFMLFPGSGCGEVLTRPTVPSRSAGRPRRYRPPAQGRCRRR